MDSPSLGKIPGSPDVSGDSSGDETAHVEVFSQVDWDDLEQLLEDPFASDGLLPNKRRCCDSPTPGDGERGAAGDGQENQTLAQSLHEKMAMLSVLVG